MLASVGDNCIDRYLPPVGVDTIGGNALNVAVGLAHHGHEAAYLGAVGADDDGRTVRAALRAAGVDTSHMVTEQGPTGVTLVDLGAGGERVFLEEIYGASDRYAPSDEALDFLARCGWVHVAGLVDAERWVPRIDAPHVSYDFSTCSRTWLSPSSPAPASTATGRWRWPARRSTAAPARRW
jgi:fructoselysine 6-kinase